MTTPSTLLPSNAGAAERAWAAASHAPLPVPIRDIMDPNRTPVRFLPWLAAHRGVDLWFEDWSTARKRQMVAEAPRLAALKGTVAAPGAYLAYVDGEVVDRVSYPTRFIMGRAIIGRTPIGHGPHLARVLARVRVASPRRGFCVGRAVIGRSRLLGVDTEPYRRALAALRIAKAAHVQMRVSFEHMRRLDMGDAPMLDNVFELDSSEPGPGNTLDDGARLDGVWTLNDFVPRKRL